MNPGFFQTVILLLKTARKRMGNRLMRGQQLQRQRTGRRSNALQTFGYAMMWFFMGMIHLTAAFALQSAIMEAQQFSHERQGSIVVSSSFRKWVVELKQQEHESSGNDAAVKMESEYKWEAEQRARKLGGSAKEHEQFLRTAVAEKPVSAFINRWDAQPGIKALAASDSYVAMMGSFVLVWWLLTLTFQAEGFAPDFQRRRHPMWEWLLSHPVHPGAVFLAEMISPFAANPMYLSAPLFAGVLFGFVYGVALGIQALFLAGIPLALATACLGKALEISVMLRCAPRSRSAILGVTGSLGFIGMFGFLAGQTIIPALVNGAGGVLYPFAQKIPSPLLGWVIGARADGSFSFLQGVGVCWIITLLMIGGGVGLSVWAARKGLSGNDAFAQPGRPSKAAFRFGKNPLYRKELLWFIRDRGAIVQAVLVPALFAGFQLMNLRNVLVDAGGSWNMFAGVAVVFGTYFLWTLGPRSLASDGSALWIAQTWPRGMEDLLKTKARLWYLISSGIVLLVFVISVFRFPSDAWKLVLVGLGWLAFGKSMAEKAVTLVSVPSSSGEPEKIPQSRRYAAALGMFTLGIGIFTQQWHLMCIGIIYSWMTSAAMWQNFRACLPYIFDPWSEKVPPPPTVMHAMIAISVLIEFGAIFSAIFIGFAGKENMAAARVLASALIAALVMLFTTRIMARRDLPAREIWSWKEHCVRGRIRFITQLAAAVAVGLGLAVAAHGYMAFMAQFEPIGEMIRASKELLNSAPGLRISYFFCAVIIAPFAEEFLFRGLLFRALDKEWGGWKALAGSAAFFAIYHPPVAWLPVGLLGLINAILFKKTGRLAPAVVLHMVYNAVVLTG
jgi:membrane protease YdiL (CAAX protease family)